MTNFTNRDVFVIHGRNLKIQNSIFKFLESLDLHPISFEEAKQKTGKGTPYNLEILKEAITTDVSIIALFTPDDIAFMNPYFHKEGDVDKEKIPMGQVRQNVIFETGFAFAINPKRTILIRFGNVREYSDISGLNYFFFEDTQEKRIELMNLLKSIGCPIREKPNYLTVGDFTIEPEILQNIPRTPSYSSKKADIINSVKKLRDLSIKIVRNEYNQIISNKFKLTIGFIYNFPDVAALLPDYISEESDSNHLHKYFKTQGGYAKRVDRISSDFTNTLEQVRKLTL